MVLSRSLRALYNSLFMLPKSGYDSSVCCEWSIYFGLLWTESPLLLAVSSEVETLPHRIPCCCLSQCFSQGHVLSGLHPHSRIAIWSAPDLILHLKCIPQSTRLQSLTPCIRLVLPFAGWHSTVPPIFRPLAYNRGPSSSFIAHREWVF